MSSERIRYGQLYDYLVSLGYRAVLAPTHVVYRKSGYRLPVVLPKASRTEEVPPSHLAAVGRILELDGIILAGPLTIPVDRAAPAPGREGQGHECQGPEDPQTVAAPAMRARKTGRRSAFRSSIPDIGLAAARHSQSAPRRPRTERHCAHFRPSAGRRRPAG